MAEPSGRRRRVVSSRLLSIVFLGCLLWPVNGRAQAPRSAGEPRLVEVEVEPDQPSFGRAFQVRATLRLPPRFIAFLPDTLLQSEAMESVGPGSWSATPGPGDSVDIQAVYPVMGFRRGTSNLPALETWVRADSVFARPAREAVRSLQELGSDPGGRGQPFLIRLGTASVIPFFSAEDSVEQLLPRPVADVTGGVWNAWLLLAAGLVTAVVIVGTRALVRRWRGESGSGPPFGASHRFPRVEALRELDRIRAQGWHRNGRLLDFYRSSTDVLRQFAQETDPAWRRALTSSELLRRIEERWGAEGAEALSHSVAVAERVKFGAHRPDAAAAEHDWETIRDWIRSLPAAD